MLASNLLDGYGEHISSKIALWREMSMGAGLVIGKTTPQDSRSLTVPLTLGAWITVALTYLGMEE